jgi:short-subunit dehydrogenase involved in D-alanine esterification of teichoic acids
VIDWLRSDVRGLDVLVNSAGVMDGGDLTAPGAATKSAKSLP